MQNKQHLISFVQNTLGCTCPNEIFEQIETAKETTKTLKQITLGQRLLIYLWETDSPVALAHELPVLVAKGKAERDQRGLNRFRLVIVSTMPEQLAPVAEQIFAPLNSDEKVHLHVVLQADIKFSF